MNECIIHQCFNAAIFHHVRSKGAGGGNEKSNLMPICPDHHNLGGDSVHRIGLAEFANRFSEVRKWLLENNWEQNCYEKWIRGFEEEDSAKDS